MNSRYKGNTGMTQNTLLLRTLGMKKVGVSFLWVNQVLTLGGEGSVSTEETVEKLYENSSKMTYLDPYFLTNYNFTGSVLGLINVFRRHDLAGEIYERGILYNPDNRVLKNYYAGVVAASKGDEETLLVNFERVVKETKDDLLTTIVSYVYEKKYNRDGQQKDLKKAREYWTILANSKDAKYREGGLRKLEDYSRIKKNKK